MIFNSINFSIFLPVVFILYWVVFNKNLIFQNRLLLVASYFFYACWNWKFLFLLFFSTFLDYVTGIKICDTNSQKVKHFWFWLSVLINVGFLAIFKYYNFFVTSFVTVAQKIGWETNPTMLEIILPVGISFYTFHGLSYVIDIYKNRIKAEKHFVDYALFVSFFPLLVAGPIERATHLLPQIKHARAFNYLKAVDGLKQILWGLFKKVVIADQSAQYANTIFNNSTHYNGSTLLVGAVLFTFQIYGDFSGYSDIAIGTARLFGMDLLRNFSFPYFSRDIAEFWRRWHISLSTWFRDYLYIPMGGSKGSLFIKIRNVFIIFLVSGFWHGANWTFIIWGLLNAIYILPSILFETNRANLNIVAQGRSFPTLREFFSILLTFCLTVFGWIFFRAQSLHHAFSIVSVLFSKSLFTTPTIIPEKLGLVIMFFIVIEWIGRQEQYAIAAIGNSKPKFIRYSFYYIIIVMILIFKANNQQFIYFQF